MEKTKPRLKKLFSQQWPDVLLQAALTQSGWCLPQLRKTAEGRTPRTSQSSSCNKMSSRKPETSETCQVTPEFELWSLAALERTREDRPLDQRSPACAEKVVIGRNSEETGSVCWYTLLSLHFTENAVAPFKARAAQFIISEIPRVLKQETPFRPQLPRCSRGTCLLKRVRNLLLPINQGLKFYTGKYLSATLSM